MPDSVSDNDSFLLEEFPEEEAPTPSNVPGEEGEASPLPSSSFDGKQHNEEVSSPSVDSVMLVEAGNDVLVQAIQEQTSMIYSGFMAISMFLGFIIGALTVKAFHTSRG